MKKPAPKAYPAPTTILPTTRPKPKSAKFPNKSNGLKPSKPAKEAAANHLEDLDRRGVPPAEETKVKALEYRDAYRVWFTQGDAGLTPEMRVLMSEKRGTNSQIAGTTTLGGYTIDTELFPQIVEAMKSYSGIAQAARFINTTGGNALRAHGRRHTATEAGLIAGGCQHHRAGPHFRPKQLDAYKYATQMKISWELDAGQRIQHGR